MDDKENKDGWTRQKVKKIFVFSKKGKTILFQSSSLVEKMTNSTLEWENDC